MGFAHSQDRTQKRMTTQETRGAVFAGTTLQKEEGFIGGFSPCETSLALRLIFFDRYTDDLNVGRLAFLGVGRLTDDAVHHVHSLDDLCKN